ncbi:hypothetical protein BD410DRAFT_825384 [Rickenella mellea]|uniref:PH domain-containing protein n=1 Tax=Rickenella mellea TaxID=50990 RepID=A0A4Y7QIJ9_9AGAM|nr:hypothetical protein BD410DRAFT_825384 [Rickenella mellea]
MHISDDSIVRSGWASVRDDEQVGETWRRKWLLLCSQVLSIHNDEFSAEHSIVKLGEVARVERVHGKERFCFELECGNGNGWRRMCVWVKSDEEMGGWMDGLTSQCLLARSMERDRVSESSKRGWEFAPVIKGPSGRQQQQQPPRPPIPPPSDPLSSFDFLQGAEGFGDFDPSIFRDDLDFERDFAAWFNPDEVQLDLK